MPPKFITPPNQIPGYAPEVVVPLKLKQSKM